ncbi:MAG: helix-turn-helix transcriptional regulator, partial [Bacilli bacterium]|nr:helix-turn-helix transcriptional regulator [Bacilli bacterium]
MECEVIVMDSERIGNLIKKLREERHFTQREFADVFGVSYQAVSK